MDICGLPPEVAYSFRVAALALVGAAIVYLVLVWG